MRLFAKPKIDRRVERAIAHFGSQKDMVHGIMRASGDYQYAISQTAISKYLRGVNRVPVELAIWIDVGTNGAVAFAEFYPALAELITITPTAAREKAS